MKIISLGSSCKWKSQLLNEQELLSAFKFRYVGLADESFAV
jgi:hypothetical protein